MVSKTSQPDWLPPGWKVQIKVKNDRKIKCYIDSKTCHKFYSKPEVLRHINDESINDDKSQVTEEHTKTSEQDMHLVVANDPYQWLPTGWTVEIRTRRSGGKKGTEYKCYIDPSGRNSFYSKPEVSRYLKSIEGNEGSSGTGRKERRSTRHSSDNRSVDQLKEKSNVEPNVSEFTKTRARKNLSSGQKQQKEMSNVEPNVSEFTKTCARENLSSGQKQQKEKSNVEPNLSEFTTARARENLSLGQTQPKEKSNVEPNVSQFTKTRARENLLSEQKQLKEKSNVGPNVSQFTKTRARENLSSGQKQVLVENTVDEDLPSGWIKEMRKRVQGNKVIRKDPFYFHPASGLVFRSKQEVLRYLETGEISRHAYRRRSGHRNEDKSAVEKNSPPSLVKSEKSTSSQHRKEHTGQGHLSSVPEVGGRRITRSYSKFKAASGSESSLVQSSLSSGTVDSSQEVQPSRLLIKMESEAADAVTKVASQSFQNGGGSQNNASMMETKPHSASSIDMVMVENTEAVAMQGRSNGKSQSSKRKMKELKQPSVPSRSSKRLAGVDAEVVFHSIPIEHARLASSIKSSKIKPTPTFGSSPDDLPEKPKTPDVPSQSLPVFQEALHQTLGGNNKLPVLAVEQRSNPDSKMQRVVHVVELDDNPPPGFSNSSGYEQQTMNSVHLSEEPQDGVRESDMRQMQLPSGCQVLPVALPGVNIELAAAHQLVQEVQPAKMSMDTEQSASDFNSPSQSPIVKLPKKQSASDFNSPSQSPIVNFAESTPPSFPGACPDALSESKIEPSNSRRPAHGEQKASMEQKTTPSFLGARPDALPESKIEPSCSGRPAPMEQQGSMRKTPSFLEARPDALPESKIEPSYSGRLAPIEQQASMHRDSEQPAASDFSFPSPMWSDPCLEFAYKTLTGAIPLDDNLAIEDYIQHQLRTTKPGNDFQNLPDVDFQNDETKLVPPLPESVRFPNGNGLGPPKTIR